MRNLQFPVQVQEILSLAAKQGFVNVITRDRHYGENGMLEEEHHHSAKRAGYFELIQLKDGYYPFPLAYAELKGFFPLPIQGQQEDPEKCGAMRFTYRLNNGRWEFNKRLAEDIMDVIKIQESLLKNPRQAAAMGLSPALFA